MKKSKQLLFSNIIDYAGTFPPEQLELKEVFIRYAKARRSRYGWILSRILVQTHWIEIATKLCSYTESIPKPIPVTLLLQVTDSFEQFKVRISATERDLLTAHNDHSGELKTDILEAALPTEILEPGKEELMQKALEFLVERLAVNRVLPHKVFLEYPKHTFDISLLKPFLKDIARQNLIIRKKGVANFKEFGFKIRLVPEEGNPLLPVENLAALLILCRELHLEVKFAYSGCKAITSLNNDNSTAHYGFMNLYAAGLLAYSFDLNLEEITQILKETDASAFTFSDTYLKWGDFIVPAGELKMLRSSVYGAFNSSDLIQTLEEIMRLKGTEA